MEALNKQFDKINPIIIEVKKDGMTLEIRKRGFFIILSNGQVTKKGIRLNAELKNYFGI